MKISKLGWLGAVVALAAVVGAVAYTPKTTEAIVTGATKTCTATGGAPAGSGSNTCVFSFTATTAAEFAAGATFAVSITGGGATFSTPIVINNNGGCATAFVNSATTITFAVLAGGCPFAPVGGVTFALTETIINTTGGPTNVTQSATSGVSGTTTSAVTSLPAFTAVAPAAPTSVAKACAPAPVLGFPAGTVVVGGAVVCTVTFTPPVAAAAVVTVSVTNATLTAIGGTGIAAPGGIAPAITVTTPIAAGPPSTVTFVCGAGVLCGGFTETFVPTAAGVLPVQAITINGVTFTAAAGNLIVTGLTAPVGAAPQAVTIASNGCSQGAVFGALVPNNVFVPGQGGFVITGAGGAITCRFTLSDAGAPAGAPAAGTTAVSSGLVAVSLQNVPAGVTAIVSASNNTVAPGIAGTGPTVQIRCGTASQALPADNVCTTVDVTFTLTGNAVVGGTVQLPVNLGVNVAYTPDLITNSTSNVNFNPLFTIGQGVNALVGPVRVVITCASSGGLAQFPTLNAFGSQFGLPSSLFAGQTPTAIGILPAAISCVVNPTDANGVPIAVAPGTFEITSLAGTLLSLSGTLTTNLRIACGDPTLLNVNTGFFGVGIVNGPINLNVCTSVSFSVLGQGVGLVDLRARYEPINSAIQEVEGATTVAFVAPVVSVALALDPNPVAVGATGTATATLSTIFGVTCNNIVLGQANTLVSAAGTCINPTTGQAITSGTNPGSSLNGVVVFSTSNSAIARFDNAGQANAGTTLNLGVTSTAEQVVRACGAFGGGGLVSPFTLTNTLVGNLQPYFGGCQTATATYRGVNAGDANISAAFVAFLPGSSSINTALTGTGTSLAGAGLANINFFAPGIGPSSTFRTLQVADVAPSGNVNLARGCNNVSPTVTESVAAYAARVSPASIVASVFQYNTATNSFAGAPGPASPASAAAVADLAGVTRLIPVFVCVTGPGTLAQPAI